MIGAIAWHGVCNSHSLCPSPLPAVPSDRAMFLSVWPAFAHQSMTLEEKLDSGFGIWDLGLGRPQPLFRLRDSGFRILDSGFASKSHSPPASPDHVSHHGRKPQAAADLTRAAFQDRQGEDVWLVPLFPKLGSQRALLTEEEHSASAWSQNQDLSG